MNRDFMDGVWRKIELLEKSEALLSIERTRTRAKARVRPKVVLVAAMLMAFFLGTAAASTDLFEQFRKWMNGMDEIYQEQANSWAVDQDIEVHVAAVMYDSARMNILLAVHDLVGGRLNQDVQMETELEPEPSSLSYSTDILEYRKDDDTLLVNLEYGLYSDYDMRDRALHINSFYYERELDAPLISLENPPEPGEVIPGMDGARMVSVGVEDDGRMHLRIEMPKMSAKEQARYDLCANLKGEESICQGYDVVWLGTQVDFVFRYPNMDECPEELERATAIHLGGFYLEYEIRGDWIMDLDVKMPETKRIVCKELTIEGQSVQEVKISGLAVRVETMVDRVRQEEAEMFELPITVYLRDGTELYEEIPGGRCSWQGDPMPSDVEYDRDALLGVMKASYIWEFSRIIDPAEVERIVVGDTEIPIE